jgi:hypothetical protein
MPAAAPVLTVYTLPVYTLRLSDEIEGFDWDAANVGHILRHAVTPLEVEEAVGGRRVTFPRGRLKAKNDGNFSGRRHPAVISLWYSRFGGSCSAP